MKAKDIMTTAVHTVRADDPLLDALVLICRHRIGGVPVLHEKTSRLVGLICERDILNFLWARLKEPGARKAQQRAADLFDLKARDVMVTDVVTAQPDADALGLASMMAARKIRRIPIVEGQRLVGVVSQGDLLKRLVAPAPQPARMSRPITKEAKGA
jgi:CBS domain-containing protein